MSVDQLQSEMANFQKHQPHRPRSQSSLTLFDRLTSTTCLMIFFTAIFIALVFVVKYKTQQVPMIREISDNIPQFDLIKLNTTTALCLDGSPAAYYISKNGDPNKIYLEFEGGGWCYGSDVQNTLENCYQRSKTRSGSSLFHSRTQMIELQQGALSQDARNNFKDWKRILFLYCDGSGHQGTRSEPVKYKDTQLYFRGHNITVETLEDLERRIGIFSKATEVVVGGFSAGGLAAYHWANYITQRVQGGRVRVIPDSGIFLDEKNMNTFSHLLREQYRTLMEISNKQIDPPVPQCVRNHPNQKQKCMFAQNIYAHLKAPLFVIQSLYDPWSIDNIIGIKNGWGSSLKGTTRSERMLIENYRTKKLAILDEITKDQRNGVFASGCLLHCFTRNSFYYNQYFRIPAGSQNSASVAVAKWLQNSTSSHVYVDRQRWPNNKKCSGLKQYL